MLDGFQYVLAQIGVVVAVTALLAGVLGWLIGRGSRRRTEKAFEQAIATLARPVPDGSPFAPAPSSEEAAVVTPPSADADLADASLVDEAPEPAPRRDPFGESLIDHVPLRGIEDPDATVIRAPSNPGTTAYLPPAAVITSVPGPRPVPHRPTPGAPVSMPGEVQQLRQELRNRDSELGRIEARALSAWDGTVPWLEQQIDDLVRETDVLRRRLREAEEHASSDALTIDRLRALVADRDAQIGRLRAQD